MKLFGLFDLKKYKADNHILGIILAIAILLPHEGVLYLVNPIMLIYLIIKYARDNQYSFIQIAMVSVIGLSVVTNVLWGVDLSSKSLIRTVYIALILLFFPFCGNKRIPSIYLYGITLFILVTQLAYVYDIDSVIEFIDAVYPYEGDAEYYDSEFIIEHAEDTDGTLLELQALRLGGLFHNSNQCLKYMSLLTIAFLIENNKKTILSWIPFMIIILWSALLAGSRTGFMIILLSIAVAIILKGSGKHFTRNLVYVLLGGATIFLVASTFMQDFRVFQISDGFNDDGSISIKFEHLNSYLQVLDSVRVILLGNASIENIQHLYSLRFTQFDSEWGNAIYFYGFMFILLYGFFLYKAVITLRGIYIITAFMLFWIVSSTILFSYRTSFAFFLLFSKYLVASQEMLRYKKW